MSQWGVSFDGSILELLTFDGYLSGILVQRA